MTASIAVVDGEVEIKLGRAEAFLVGQLAEVIPGSGSQTSPAIRSSDNGAGRPPVRDDAEADAEWWRLISSDLEEGRRHDSEVISVLLSEAGSRRGTRLDASQAEQLLRLVNHARLGLATGFGIKGPEDYDTLDHQQAAVLDFLGWMVEMLSDSLTELTL